MLHILDQIYSQKEYIDIELIGVDSLDELGIKPLDYKIRIPKNRRYNTWVSEVNGCVKTRIDYAQRPKSWDQYVSKVDEIRNDINKLIQKTIRLIDDVYKKGGFTKERLDQVKKQIGIFQKHNFLENYLPVSVVDPYCLYSEGQNNLEGENNIAVSEIFPISQLLSVEKYKCFREYFNRVISSLGNFYTLYRQFGDMA